MTDPNLIRAIGVLEGKVDTLVKTIEDQNSRLTASVQDHNKRIGDLEEMVASHIARQQQNSYLLKAAASVAGIMGVLAGIGVAIRGFLNSG